MIPKVPIVDEQEKYDSPVVNNLLSAGEMEVRMKVSNFFFFLASCPAL